MTPPTGQQPAPDAAGFTLLELLIAFSLVALVLGLAFGGFEQVTAQLEKGRKTLLRNQERTVVTRFLRKGLEGQRDLDRKGPEGSRIAFRGKPDSIRFVAPMFPHQERTGLYEMRYRWTGRRLVLDWRPFRSAPQEGSGFQHRVVSREITDATFRYYGKREAGDRPEWLRHWSHADRPPQAVRIALTGSRESWPPLVVRLRETR